MRRALGVSLLLLLLALPATADARLRVVPVARGFDSPVQVTAPRGSSGVLFVVEQEGRIWRLAGGRRTLFLDIRDLVGCCGERGLLALALHPSYTANGLLFVHYTNRNGDTRVVRMRANSTRTRGRRSTMRVLLSVDQPFANHNGGQLAFGPDGLLYLGLGDGGSGCDPGARAQNLGSRLGKVLRRTSRGWEVFIYGVRNPWRFSFDRANGNFYVGDVGQVDREEIDFLPASALADEPLNFGWDIFEGELRDTCEHGPLNTAGRLVDPILTYGRGQGFTVIGGFVYRGRRLPAQRGRYFYGDLDGSVWSFRVRDGRAAARRTERFTVPTLVSFGESGRGELYLVSLGGTIFRLASS